MDGDGDADYDVDNMIIAAGHLYFFAKLKGVPADERDNQDIEAEYPALADHEEIA